MKVLAVTSATFQSQLMFNVPISICTAQLQARSALCFISLIKSLNFAGLLECNILGHILVTAQGRHPSHHLHCSTSGPLNLNFAGLLKSFAAHHGHRDPTLNLKPKSAESFTRPFAVRNALRAQAGAGAAGEQTAADHGGGESGEADSDPPQLNRNPPALRYSNGAVHWQGGMIL